MLTLSSYKVWNLHEQICIAALELGDYGLAESSINILGKQFSSSHRVNRLRGMLLEAQGSFYLEFLVTPNKAISFRKI